MYIYCTEVKQEIAIRKFANFIMKSKDTTRRQILPPIPLQSSKKGFFRFTVATYCKLKL